MPQWHRHQPGFARALPQRQRGAALIMAAGVIVAMVTMMALAIDLGQVYATKENLDTAANIAALEASRAIAGCNAGGVPANPEAAALAAAQASVARAYANRSEGAPSVTTVVGAMQRSGGTREFAPNAAVPAPVGDEQPVTNSAVNVVLSDGNYRSITGAFFKPVLTSSASASAMPTATFSVGSSLLRLNPAFLGPLGIDVGLFDQGSLLDTNLSLGDLAVELGAGTVDDLLNLDLQTGNLLEAINEVSGQSLGNLSAALSTSLSETQVSLGSVIANVGSLGQTVQVNAEALANSLLQLALAERANGIPIPLDLNVLGLVGVVANVRILEPPQVAVGVRPGLESSYARDSQILVELAVNINIDLLNLGLARLQGSLPVYVKGGSSEARLDAIDCANSTRQFHEVDISGTAETASIGIGRFDDISAPDPQPVLGADLELRLIGLTVLGLNIDASQVPVGSSSGSLTPVFTDPPAAGDDGTRNIPGGVGTASALGGLSSSLTNVQIDPNSLLGLGSLLAPLVNSVLATLGDLTSIVAGLVADIALDPVLNELLDGLGVSLGNAEVTLLATDVDQPVLFESS